MSDDSTAILLFSCQVEQIAFYVTFLQPDIAKFSSELLPILFDHVAKAAIVEKKDVGAVTRVYFALEKFCENLGRLAPSIT